MNDDELHRLLTDAVSDIEPEDRIDELRASLRPAPRPVAALHTRPWYAAAAIVAAVIGVVAYVASVAGDRPSGLDPASDGGSTQPTQIATDTAAPSPSTRSSQDQLTVYYLGHGPRGDVLFQEQIRVAGNPFETAVAALMTPSDPDYHTAWPVGSVISADFEHGVVRAKLGSIRAHRRAGMSARTANESIQQAVYTLVAASGHPEAKVQFLRNGKPAPSVLGVRTNHPLAPGRAGDVLSPINITSPSEGQDIGHGWFAVTGTNNGSDGTVVIQLVSTSPSGDTTVLTDSGTASGSGDPSRLYPWRVALDTSDVAPGTYVLTASNLDPSGGTDGSGPAIDTRTVVIP
ncbi:MAG TPA: Gmad2 immunoglobulin-like domain-containing protein [Nocardioides sp.]|jgi:hypothetical protein|nr:Gmad2 immunoglobulin-like domain-containing protein [Nocardioides sp.]